MLKNKKSNLDIKAHTAAILQTISIGVIEIFSTIFQSRGYNPPGAENCMLVPTAVQSTSYYVSQTTKFHP
jgi:hypothetical protein